MATWKDVELKILTENLDKTIDELIILLPGRDKKSINNKIWDIKNPRKNLGKARRTSLYGEPMPTKPIRMSDGEEEMVKTLLANHRDIIKSYKKGLNINYEKATSQMLNNILEAHRMIVDEFIED